MKNHKKPTEDYGYISFGKNGKVKKEIFRLSPDKEEQEIEVIEKFFSDLKESYPEYVLIKKKRLPESNNDFEIITSQGNLIVELTELVERDYAKQLSREEYHREKFDGYIVKEPGSIPWGVNDDRVDTSLRRIIEKKINKHYSKPISFEFWLVIFSTSAFITPEFIEAGKCKRSKSLINAQKFLQTSPDCVFNKIWFTNLLTRPVMVWPIK